MLLSRWLTSSLAVASAAVVGTGLVVAPAHAGAADFSVTMTGPGQVQVEDHFRYDLAVSHEGKGQAGTRLTVALSAELVVRGLSSAGSDEGSCTFSAQRVDCTFDQISNNNPATVSVDVRAAVAGTGTATATLAADAVDSNNVASVSTAVTDRPVEPQAFTSPYDSAVVTRYGSANPATGAVQVLVPATCEADCGGAAGFDQRLVLSGTGSRTWDVEVVFDVGRIRESIPLAADVDAVVHLFATGGASHGCNVDLDGLLAERSGERVVVRCSWPTSILGGTGVMVRAFVYVHAQPSVEVEASAVVSAINVGGTSA